MLISYLIGSYSTDLMGNAHHEEVIHALQARGVEIEVLTLIAERGAPALECREIHGVPVWQINALAGLGYLMSQALNYSRTDILTMCIIIYGVIGITIDTLIRSAEKVTTPWADRQRARRRPAA